ncbi:ATP-binding protein [Maribacter hydrothermalis]|uniref:AAA+ ATPase domain-containing protein n=1 Tax=Maribacter hydrothermalis TaxID=1836467 RepID=A0A1B7ZF31_9FLAO|nr:ATP-binding protein [Maribacter hydrothermalis]APQ17685.1 hypothetical protein BTR34_10250 [Maribacter hydrothermalis]OBR42160.1 hypothetical protein A9200_01875 [Maribacter hydrothermalis]
MIETEVTTSNTILKQSVHDLKTELNQYKDVFVENRTHSELKAIVSNKFLKICKSFLSVGQNELELLERETGEIGELAYLMHFRLPNFFKDLMIIHRDVLLQLQIGKHKKLEGVATKKALELHSAASQNTLIKAVDFFIQKFREEELATERISKTKSGVVGKVRHHQNPWNTYVDQFEIVLAQFNTINNNDAIVKLSIRVFKDLVNRTNEITAQSISESEEIVNKLQYCISNIEKIDSKEDILRIIQELEKIEVSIDAPQNYQEGFTQSIADISNNLQRTNIPVATNGGYLLERKVDFGRSAKKWMDFNIIPQVIELWDNKSELFAFAKHSIFNLKGSLVVAKNEEFVSGSAIEIQSLKSIEETFKENLKEQQNLVTAISKIFETDFLATSIYREEEFLEVSLQNSLNQYTSETNDRFTNWIGKISGFFGNVNMAYDKVVSVKPKDLLEISTDCIAHRMFKEENAQYDMLFLNKNFLGDHFLTSRINEEEVFEKVLEQWDKGFHKSVLVVGDNHSGKSTFINKVVKKSLKKEVIALDIDSTITFQGRKFNTTKNLKVALQEIKKYRYNSKPIIIIDDLELWVDKSHAFLDNIRAVLKFAESEADDILLVVSVSKLMQQHLNHRLSFTNSFSTLIDLSSSTNAEIFNAVRLRHGASHRKLVDINDELISPLQFEKLVYRLCKRFGNTIGEVLQAWTYGTSLTNDNKVVYSESTHYFPDFFTNEEVILLKYVLLYKIIDERTIKSFLGKRYAFGYESGLKRLVNTKVLVRDQRGFLSLNAVVSYEIQQSLIYRGILK